MNQMRRIHLKCAVLYCTTSHSFDLGMLNQKTTPKIYFILFDSADYFDLFVYYLGEFHYRYTLNGVV